MSAPCDGRGTTGTIFRVSGAHPPSSCADVVLRRCDIFPHTTPPLLMLLLLLWLLVPGGHATSPAQWVQYCYNTVSCFSLLRCCAVSLMQLLLSCALCAIWVWVWALGFLNTGSAEDGAQKCGTKCQMRVIKRCFSCRQDTGLLEDFIVTRREICKKRSSCQFGVTTWHSVHITRHNTLHHHTAHITMAISAAAHWRFGGKRPVKTDTPCLINCTLKILFEAKCLPISTAKTPIQT